MSLNSKKVVEFSILAVLGFTLYFGYTSYHHWKYKQALKSDNQIQECGKFIERKEIVKESSGKAADSIGAIYTFKNSQGELFSFSGIKYIHTHLPRLSTLQPQQPICFQYAPIWKDENGLFPLTKLY
ncbi:hypothetical protein [Acinetobacter sp. ANC 3813]|uniref:hypothetical protein n=1 Tax=Acinetobacter sp. ANC 3813 TaxID=1977873 RepID=UPI000A32BB41|nr:hypothetical protein [Acinetobacter sp. ANC 3813]OTG86043.1 hypothetical protein B9T34_18305 [Acinetobacter sp. ANC 3813]